MCRKWLALAMVAEVVHRAPYCFRDRVRFSRAHGGNNRHPYPIPIKIYDETVRFMKSAPEISLPARSYFAYLPKKRWADPHTAMFCDWLERQGRDLVHK